MKAYVGNDVESDMYSILWKNTVEKPSFNQQFVSLITVWKPYVGPMQKGPYTQLYQAALWETTFQLTSCFTRNFVGNDEEGDIYFDSLKALSRNPLAANIWFH